MIEKLEKDMIEALKNKEKDRLTVIREIKSGIKLAQIDQKKEMNDDLLIEIVSKAIKTRKESVKEFEKGARQDLIDKTNFEIDILNAYLPAQLSKEEIEQIVENAFQEVKPTALKDMGKIMGVITPLLKGKADMGIVSQMVKEKLGNL
ncbi:MAG: GatB/YqeY domain-containing protein [Bacilli bacterium]|nr:GatB/YqeY domain-containing protein [Bacilli bacterium]